MRLMTDNNVSTIRQKIKSIKVNEESEMQV